MPRIKDLPDYLVGISIIGIAIYLFIAVSRITALIYMGSIIGGTILLSYLISANGVLKLRYRSLIQVLTSREVSHEKEIKSQISWSEPRIHRAFYSLAKRWRYKPLVVFHRNQYVYVSPIVIGQIEHVIRESLKKQEYQGSINTSTVERDALKEIQLQHPFETRAEFDAIVSKVRDRILNK